INDYGQTLERADREQLEHLIGSLKERGVSLVYLASWHDPFGDIDLYARAIFSAWGLPTDALLVVFLRGEDRRWQVAARAGERVGPLLPQPEWEDLLAEARVTANRAQPAVAVENLATGLLSLLTTGRQEPQEGRRSWTWAYAVAGLIGIGALILAARAFLCPHCLRPLRRRPSLGGILWVCPRCRYTRASRR
ncbi:MAG: TPM domain-containing protein, partial [Candidatus Bipolaricaulis anaerobius]|nr:TPM domain-containing protein [Candidatus Bipolaricaulis anaerobius]